MDFHPGGRGGERGSGEEQRPQRLSTPIGAATLARRAGQRAPIETAPLIVPIFGPKVGWLVELVP